MRSTVTRLLFVVVFGAVGCSSADTLPSGGPYGGSVVDAAAGGDTDAGPGLIQFTTKNGSGTGTGLGSATGTTSPTGQTTSGPASTTQQSSEMSSSMATTMTTPSSSSAVATPTWTDLYNTYLSSATATIGDCDGSCHHHSECSSPSACYTWIGSPSAQKNYGALSNGGGLLSWDNGYMPTTGPSSDPTAEAAFAAWIAAGSPNN